MSLTTTQIVCRLMDITKKTNNMHLEIFDERGNRLTELRVVYSEDTDMKVDHIVMVTE